MRQREQLREQNNASPTDRGRLFLAADGRSVEGRRWSMIHTALLEDLGWPKVALSSTAKMLVRNCASLQLSIEIAESLLIESDPAYEPAELSKLVGTLNRTLDRLGVAGLTVGGPRKEREPATLEEHVSMRLKEKAEKSRSMTK